MSKIKGQGPDSIQRSPVMVKLGTWSFAFYLLHATVIYVFLTSFGRQDMAIVNVLWYLPVFALVLAGAWALYRFVERPAEQVMRAWGNRELN